MSIEPHRYADPATFHDEWSRLFDQRYFVGRATDLPAVDDYRAFTAGSRRITLRNTGQGVRAYSNVCLHRASLVDPEGCGHKPFRCGYHGWSYGADGALMQAPLSDPACIRRRQLLSYPIAEADGLLFAGFNGIAPEVSKVFNALAQVGAQITAPFYRGTLAHRANWKLLVENVLETYHLSFVHPLSFLPAGFTSTIEPAWDCDEYTCWTSLVPSTARDRRDAIRKLMPEAGHHYRHAYVFPNFFISNTNDLIGFMSSLTPLAHDRTELTWDLFELPALQALPDGVREFVRNEAIRFTTAALDEDKMLVESCQLGMASTVDAVQLQPLEARLQRFHGYYREAMGDV